jgi:hypothetical protein
MAVLKTVSNGLSQPQQLDANLSTTDVQVKTSVITFEVDDRVIEAAQKMARDQAISVSHAINSLCLKALAADSK